MGQVDKTSEPRLLPTPVVNDMGEGKTPPDWDEWTAKVKAKHGNGNGHGASLAIEAQRLLPTPMANEAEKAVAGQSAAHRKDGGHHVWLTNVVHDLTLLPTPKAGDGEKGGPNQRGSSGDLTMPSAAIKMLPTPMVGSTSPASHGQISGQYRAQMEEAFQNWGVYGDAIRRWEGQTRPAPAPTELGAKGSPRLSARFTEWMMGLPEGWITDVPGITRNEALKACGNGVVPQQAAAALKVMLRNIRDGGNQTD